MTDVLDEVINRLPPSCLRDLLRDLEQTKIKETNRELKRKITDLKSKTEENRKLLLKLQSELDVVKSLKATAPNAESAETYTEKINEFKKKMDNLAKKHDNVDLVQLFKDIEALNLEAENYRKKISEEKAKCECYEGFPANITEGKKTIASLKEKITKEKVNEFVMNSLSHP